MEPTKLKALKASVKDFKAIAKKIGFPFGEKTRDHTKPYKGMWVTDAKGKKKYDESAENWEGIGLYLNWHKSHGHAGRNTIARVVEKALKAGFVAEVKSTHNTPDGSTMGSGTVYVKMLRGKEVARLSTSSSYGVTAYENSFSMTLTGPKVNAEGE